MGRMAIGCLAGLVISCGIAAGGPPNYDEANVGSLVLPDPLSGPDGRAATSVETWTTVARPHQLALLEANVFGRRLPQAPVAVVGAVERADVVLPGDVKARRLQARLRLGAGDAAPITEVLLYLPGEAREPVPVLLGLNFLGNQAEYPDDGIWLSSSWVPNDKAAGIDAHRATEASRGWLAHRWPVPAMLRRGYGMATASCGDVFPDRAPDRGTAAATPPAPDEPGAMAAWAWQLSRILDWLVTLPEVRKDAVAVVGFSRLGKAALWAGACDERFAAVVSMESGCGGAALSRRNYGETIADITGRFPHWFCPRFASFAGRETELPCDQHCLLALVAPRPLYVTSAVEDRWSDPRGEFLACVAAEPAWRLFGREGLATGDYPPVDTPVGRTVGYHVRAGRHELLAYDWQRCADFLDRSLLGRTPPPADDHGAFHPVQAPLPVEPPAGATVLVDADGRVADTADRPAFVSMAGGPIDWTVREGGLEVAASDRRSNHIVSTTTFRDADIHAEFVTSPEGSGNSGLYLHGLYELQILDSVGSRPPQMQDEGALYRFAPPLVNAALPTGRWQVYDVRFIAPRRDARGVVTKPGHLTAWLNGKLVQDAIEFADPRSPYTPYKHGVTDFMRGVEKRILETGAGPLVLQDHGSRARFRNVWIRPLDDAGVSP
jgi:hypothetical protein